MTTYELGELGERYVALLLHQAGLEVERAGPSDLLANGVPIEVKSARPSRVLGNRRKVLISASPPWGYRGKWSNYLNAWEVAARILGE